jgi:hypothetical protein
MKTHKPEEFDANSAPDRGGRQGASAKAETAISSF